MDRRRFLTLGGLLALPLEELTRLTTRHLLREESLPAVLTLELWTRGRKRDRGIEIPYEVVESPQGLRLRSLIATARFEGPGLIDELRIRVPGHESLVWSKPVGIWWLEPGEGVTFTFGD